MSGYPGLIGKWMSGEIVVGRPGAGSRMIGEVVGGSDCHPDGHVALLVDGRVYHVAVSSLRVEKRPPLPRPEPTGMPGGGR